MKALYNLSTLLVLTVGFSPGRAVGQSDTESAVVSPGAHASAPGAYLTRSFVHDGRTRMYKLYVAASYDGQEEWPLVLSFHGQTQSSDVMREIDRLSLIADTAHFLVAYPQGLNTPQPQFPNTPGWNVHGAFGDWDDVEFVSRLIDHIQGDYRVNPRRVHATGFSHGSAMSFTLACLLADRIASIGSVSGPMPDVYFSGCEVDRPVSTLLFHGTSDPTHPITGYTPGNYMTRPVPETPAFWANHNNCSPEPTVTQLPDIDTQDRTTVTLIEYPDCDEGTQVQFYRIEGGAHTWSGNASQSRWGPVNMDIDASSLIWDFFTKHPHPEPSADYFYLSTQAEVDSFPVDRTELPHYLWIANSSDITDLSSLSGITSVDGHLDITSNSALTSLDGLSALASLGTDLTIAENDVLGDLGGLSSLSAVGGGLSIRGNQTLGSLGGLAALTSLGKNLAIENNPGLGSLAGLSGLTSVPGDLEVSGNEALTSLEGLSAVASVGGTLRIDHNDALTGLEGLSSMASLAEDLVIENNDSLTSLAGLSGLVSIPGGLKISRNPALTNLSGLDALTTVTGSLDILTNLSLEYVDGISSLNTAGRLRITQNPAMTSLDGLSGLVSVTADVAIYGNDALQNLDGLNALTSVGARLRIYQNPVLASCSCGIFTLVSSGGIGGAIRMYGNDNGGDCNQDGADLVDNACVAVGIEADVARPGVPTEYALHEAYPNPFNPTTTISYTLPEIADVRLTVHDLLGRSQRVLVSGSEPAGRYEVVFDAAGLPSGAYFYRLEAGQYVETKRMVLVK